MFPKVCGIQARALGRVVVRAGGRAGGKRRRLPARVLLVGEILFFGCTLAQKASFFAAALLLLLPVPVLCVVVQEKLHSFINRSVDHSPQKK